LTPNYDKNLIESILRGNKEDFGKLFEKYNQYLVNFLLRFTKYNLSQSEDIAQDVWIKIYDNLGKFNLNMTFKSWMFRVAHNHALDVLRKSKKIYFYYNDQDLDILKKTASDFGSKIENKILLEKILQNLKLEEKELLDLAYLQGFSITELSDIFRVSNRQITVKLYKLKQKIKKLFL
jgi:RNA polymerase sigma factor (sigma-70 family)